MCGQQGESCNSGPTTAHNEPTCTPSASLAASVATDRDAVETVTRFRDSVLNAVAPVEVVLPIYEHPDVNSTEALTKTIDCSTVEEALRHEGRDHGLPMVEHSPMGRNQGLARKHVRSAASTTQVGTATSTTCHLVCLPGRRARFVHVRASMEGTPPHQLASPGQTARERI